MSFLPSRASERSWRDLAPSASLYCFRTVVRVSPFCVTDELDHWKQKAEEAAALRREEVGRLQKEKEEEAE